MQFFVILSQGRTVAREEESPVAEVVEATAEDADREARRALDGAKVGQKVSAMRRPVHHHEESTHDSINIVALRIGRKSGAGGNKPVMAFGVKEGWIEDKERHQRDGGSVLVGEPHGVYQGVDVVKLLGK